MDGLEYWQTEGKGKLSFCKIDHLIVKTEKYPFIEKLIFEYSDLTKDEQKQFIISLLKYVTEIPNPELWKDVFNDRNIGDAKNLMSTELSKEGQRSFKDWATKIYFAIKYNKLISDIAILNSNKEAVITKKMVDNFYYFFDLKDSTEPLNKNFQRLKAYTTTEYIQKNATIKQLILQIYTSQDFQLELKKALNFKRYSLPMPDDFDKEKLRILFQELKESKKRIESEKGEEEKSTKNKMQFIDTETKETVFLSLYQDGIEDGIKIKWIEKKYYFDYLMRELYDIRQTRKQIVDTLRNVFVNEKGNGLVFLPDPNGRDQKADTTSKQNIIKNIVINCKKNKR